MEIQQQLTFELRRRAGLLPKEIGDLKALADSDDKGMGIHQSQIDALKLLLDGLQEQQGSAIKGLEASLPAEEFAAKRVEIEQLLTGAYSIMGTFHYIFAQRSESPDYKRTLDMADLIAANCYKPCMELANNWRGLARDNYREPPLTFLNAMLSPAAISRRYALKKVGLQLYGELEQQLPISIISLPFHDSVAVWTFCSLYHEIGHLLDNDLNLRKGLGEALSRKLKQPDQESDTLTFWTYWLPEMIGDTFGVLLGGAGFAYAIANMLYKAGDDIKSLSEDKHPNEYVRIFLIGALLRGTGVKELSEAASKIEQAWLGIYGRIDDLEVYKAECRDVASVLLSEKLESLKSHSLIELSPTLAADHAQTDRLATWLRDELGRPAPETYPFRLVPAAAQLAVTGVTTDFENNYDAIQKRTLEFLSKIKRPRYLGPTGGGDGRKAYLQGLIEKLDFSVINIENH